MERGLCATGVNVTTVTTDDDGPSRRLTIHTRSGQANGVRRVYFRKWFDFYKIAPAMLPWLWRHVRSFDVVHIHALFSFTSTAASLIANWRGVPYVIRPLGTLSRYGVTQRRPWLKRLSLAALDRGIIRRAAAVHFTSQAEWQEAEQMQLPLRPIIIPLGAEGPPPGDAQRLLQDHPVLHGRQVVLYLSRLDPKKNVEGLLQAFAKVRTAGHDAVLVIAGGGRPDHVECLRRLGLSLKLEPYLVWLGHLEAAEKAAAFAAADLFVLPSYSENFGVAAVEAMLSGLPCVLGEGVAIAEECTQNGASIVVSPDPDSIARALIDLLMDEQKRKELGRRARKFATREYSVPIMAGRLGELYERIARQSGAEIA